jgi:hypothetical protein
VEEVIGHVWGKAVEASQELRWFLVAHFFEREKLANVLLPGSGE